MTPHAVLRRIARLHSELLECYLDLATTTTGEPPDPGLHEPDISNEHAAVREIIPSRENVPVPQFFAERNERESALPPPPWQIWFSSLKSKPGPVGSFVAECFTDESFPRDQPFDAMRDYIYSNPEKYPSPKLLASARATFMKLSKPHAVTERKPRGKPGRKPKQV